MNLRLLELLNTFNQKCSIRLKIRKQNKNKLKRIPSEMIPIWHKPRVFKIDKHFWPKVFDNV